MERIRCPHCNAVNQDAEPTGGCWQCGKPLSAPAGPASVVETLTAASPPPSVAARGLGQNASTLESRVAARKAARKTNYPAMPIIIIALIVVVLLLVFFALRR